MKISGVLATLLTLVFFVGFADGDLDHDVRYEDEGTVPVRLPRTARRVVDVTTDRVVAENADHLDLDLEAFQTAVLLVEDL